MCEWQNGQVPHGLVFGLSRGLAGSEVGLPAILASARCTLVLTHTRAALLLLAPSTHSWGFLPCSLTAASSELFGAQPGSPLLGQDCHMVSRSPVPTSPDVQRALSVAQGPGSWAESLACPRPWPSTPRALFRTNTTPFSFLVSTVPLPASLQPSSHRLP